MIFSTPEFHDIEASTFPLNNVQWGRNTITRENKVICIKDLVWQSWLRWFSKIDEKDSWRLQVVSNFSTLYKNCYNFSKWKVVKPPTRSLDSSYTEHGNPHLHTEHCLNRLSHEYIDTWLPLATLSVHALKLLPSHDPFQKWHFIIMMAVYCTARGWFTAYGISTLVFPADSGTGGELKAKL